MRTRVLTIPRPIPSDQLRRRILEIEGVYYLVLQVHHRHVSGMMVTNLDVEQILDEDVAIYDGHHWAEGHVVNICGMVPRRVVGDVSA